MFTYLPINLCQGTHDMTNKGFEYIDPCNNIPEYFPTHWFEINFHLVSRVFMMGISSSCLPD